MDETTNVTEDARPSDVSANETTSALLALAIRRRFMR